MRTDGSLIDRIDRFSHHINAAIEQSLFVLGAAMIGVVAAQVFYRYALNQSLFWSEELARYILVWLTFLGATVAYRRGLHPSIDLLTTRLGDRAGGAMRVISHLVAMGFFAMLVTYGSQFAYFVRFQISPALQLPKWTIMLVLPISGMVLLLHAFVAVLVEIRERNR